MSLFELFVLAVGLSMDAFAASICKGLSLKKLNAHHAVTVGLYFGGFQAGMPLIGYLLGMQFQQLISNIDHWIAFVLLVLIGTNMVRESREEAEVLDDQLKPKAMLGLAVATSIDALAVGVTLAFLNVSILPAVSFIGVVTFTLSALGVALGHRFGAKYKSQAELVGGIVLILMGSKILCEHLGFLSF